MQFWRATIVVVSIRLVFNIAFFASMSYGQTTEGGPTATDVIILGSTVTISTVTELTPEPEAESTSDPVAEATADSATSEPEAEATSEPEAESTSEPEAEVMSEPEAEATSEPEAEATSEPEAEATSEPEGTPEAEAEATSVPEAEVTSEPEAEAMSQPEAEVTSEPEAEATSQPEAEATSEPEAEATSEPEAEVTSEPEAEATSEPEAEVTSEPEAEATSEPEAEVTSEPEAEATSEPEADVTSEPEVTSEPKAEATSEPEAEVASEPEVTSEPGAEGTSEPEAEVTSEPEAEATSEPEVTSEPEAEVTSEPEAEGTSEPEAEASSEPEAEATSEPEAEVTSEPEAEVTSEPEAQGTSEPEAEVASEPEGEVTSEPEVEAESEAASEASCCSSCSCSASAEMGAGVPEQRPSAVEIVIPPVLLIVGLILALLFLLIRSRRNSVKDTMHGVSKVFLEGVLARRRVNPDPIMVVPAKYATPVKPKLEETEPFFDDFDLEVLESLRRIHNQPKELLIIAMPAVISLALCPFTLYLYDPFRKFMWPEEFDRPDINDAIACYLSPAGLVYATSFGFAFQQVLNKHHEILTKMTEEISMLDQIATFTTKLSVDIKTKMAILTAVKTECMFMVLQVLDRDVDTYKHPPKQDIKVRIWSVLDLLREVSTSKKNYVDRVLCEKIIAHIMKLNSICSDRLGILHARIHPVKWIFLETLGFFSFLGILLLSAHSYRMELVMCIVTVFSISMLCYVVSDLDSPFSGFFRVDIGVLEEVLSRLDLMYEMGKQGHLELFYPEKH